MSRWIAVMGVLFTLTTSAGGQTGALCNPFVCNTGDGEAGGDVVGPASCADNIVARFGGVDGKVIQCSGITIDDINNLSGVSSVIAGGLEMGLSQARIGPGSEDLMAAGYLLSWTSGSWNGTRDLRVARGAAGILRIDDGAGGGAVLHLVPTDSPPACDDSLRGGIYFNDTLGEHCGCRGPAGSATWQQLDGGGSC